MALQFSSNRRVKMCNRRFMLVPFGIGLLFAAAASYAETVTAEVNVGTSATAMGINSVTNKIYVALLPASAVVPWR